MGFVFFPAKQLPQVHLGDLLLLLLQLVEQESEGGGHALQQGQVERVCPHHGESGIQN